MLECYGQRGALSLLEKDSDTMCIINLTIILWRRQVGIRQSRSDASLSGSGSFTHVPIFILLDDRILNLPAYRPLKRSRCIHNILAGLCWHSLKHICDLVFYTDMSLATTRELANYALGCTSIPWCRRTQSKEDCQGLFEDYIFTFIWFEPCLAQCLSSFQRNVSPAGFDRPSSGCRYGFAAV